jgi:probable DNA metabolism protein
MIMFSDNAQSILKAFILSKLTGDTILTEGSSSLLLFSGAAIINTDSYRLEELAQQYKEQFHRSADWLHTHKGNELMLVIYKALKHSSDSKYSVIFKAVEDAFTKGIEFCLQGASLHSKKLRSLCSDVNHEVYRMMGFIRFKPAGEKCLVAKPLLFHDTVDLILKEFQSKYPNHRIIIIAGQHTRAIENGRLFDIESEAYKKYLREDIYDSVWEEYYKSQYIEPRKNIKLAAAKIPKKYWDWMPEGKILKGEE